MLEEGNLMTAVVDACLLHHDSPELFLQVTSSRAEHLDPSADQGCVGGAMKTSQQLEIAVAISIAHIEG